jgi:hypothetical protein
MIMQKLFELFIFIYLAKATYLNLYYHAFKGF